MTPVVFDCDGVLVDSEHLAWRAWRETMEPFGIEISNDDIAHLTGRSEEDTYRTMAGRGSLPSRSETWELVGSTMYRLFESHLQAFEDAFDTLEVLAERRVPLAVASSSPRERLDVSLNTTGLDAFFLASVAGDEVESAKPDPEIFLRSAELLGVEPSDCVAVEDSPSGIEAAKAAGMGVVAVDRGLFALERLAAAHVVVPRLTPAVLLNQ